MSIVGFSRGQDDWCWRALIVKGLNTYRIPLPYPIYLIVNNLYKTRIKNKLEEYK